MNHLKSLSLVITLVLFSFALAGCTVPSSQQPTSTVSPTAQQPTWEIKIIDGNVVKVESSRETTILVNKNDYQGVTAFADPQVSPDQTKVCFLAHTIVPVWLYYADTNGSQVVPKIDLAKNCVWSPDSQKIAYNNHTTDVSPVDVRVYDTQTQTKTNYTQNLSTDSLIRAYELPQWSPDSETITAAFTGLDFNNPNHKPAGTSTINLTTSQVTDN